MTRKRPTAPECTHVDLIKKACASFNSENTFIHQCSRMTNKSSTETDKHGVALHYTSQDQLRSQHLNDNNKKKLFSEHLREVLYIIWQAEGDISVNKFSYVDFCNDVLPPAGREVAVQLQNQEYISNFTHFQPLLFNFFGIKSTQSS